MYLPENLIMQLYGLGGFEWVIIVIVIVLVFFGVKKIPELARSFGKASSEFEKARLVARREVQQLKNQNGDTNLRREKLESVADTLGIDHYGKTDDDLTEAINAELNRTTKNKKCID
jgi:sec-independent protein translocase protein TatA